jgi:hypothetical protein
LIVEAVESAGLAQTFASGMEIQQVVRRKRGPGRPRSLSAPTLGRYRALSLPDERTLKAAHKGPTGDWIVYLEGAPERAWAGRSLLRALSELFELPHGKKEDWV